MVLALGALLLPSGIARPAATHDHDASLARLGKVRFAVSFVRILRRASGDS